MMALGRPFKRGYLTQAGGTPGNSIAKWDGSTWSPLASGATGGPQGGWVFALTVFDDGGGPALLAGGEFTVAGGAPANSIAKWSCGSSISISSTQPTGPGSAVFVNNANLTPGHEYYNLFSVDLCPGGPGIDPTSTFGACLFTPANIASIIGQFAAPVRAEPIHVIAPSSYVNWAPFNVGPVTVDATCIDVTGGVIGPVSPVVRLTVQ